MSVENGEWIMHGLSRDDPRRLRSAQELEAAVIEAGFLPLFGGAIPGFSVEERTFAPDWWSEDPARDPWLWRQILARRGNVAYGKFFGGRAGFIAPEYLPLFANVRRDGYDFDALWEDGKARHRAKKIMDLFGGGEELFSFEIKRLAGFGAEGEKNFDGAVTALQMQTYLVIRDFRCRTNKRGAPYGWPIAVYCTPESIWGYDAVTAAYGQAPDESRGLLRRRLRQLCPDAPEKAVDALIG